MHYRLIRDVEINVVLLFIIYFLENLYLNIILKMLSVVKLQLTTHNVII